MAARSRLSPQIVVGEPDGSARRLLPERWIALRGGMAVLARSLFPPQIVVGEPYGSVKYLLREHWIALRGGAGGSARLASDRLHALLQPLELDLLQVSASAAPPDEERHVLRVGGPLTIDTPRQLGQQF